MLSELQQDQLLASLYATAEILDQHLQPRAAAAELTKTQTGWSRVAVRVLQTSTEMRARSKGHTASPEK